MYEEVSTRMDNLERAYAQAESEVRYSVVDSSAGLRYACIPLRNVFCDFL